MPAQQAADVAMERGVTKRGVGAGMVLAPSPEPEGETLPEVEEVREPDLEGGYLSEGLSAMPAGPQTAGPSGQGATGFYAALDRILPDWDTMLADGSLVGPSGVLSGESVAKALGIPMEALLSFAAGGQ